MNLYLEYEIYKRKYYEAQQNFDTVLSEKEEIFAMTQPKATTFDKELVNGGSPKNTFEEYIIEKEKKQIDERLEEARLILFDRGKLLELKLVELRESKAKHDRVYVARYIDRIHVYNIPNRVNYSERQVYRILEEIRKSLKKVGMK